MDVHVVNVDVRVTDRQGEPIRGLEAGDFVLREDGDKVKVEYFREIPAREIPARADVDGAADQAGDEAAPESLEKAPGLLVFLVDDGRVEPGTRRRFLTSLWQILGAEFDPAKGFDPYTAAAIAVVDGSGLSVVAQPTGELAPLLAAVEQIENARPRGIQRKRQEEAFLREVLAEVETTRSELRADLIDVEEATERLRRQLREVQMDAANRRQEDRDRLAAVATLIDALAGMPGRKSIVYFGEGLAMRPGAAARQAIQALFDEITAGESSETTRSGSINSRSAALGALSDQARSPQRRTAPGKGEPPSELLDVAALAAEARVSFYPWKAVESLSSDASSGAAGASPAVLAAHEASLVASLGVLAEATGGELSRGGDLSRHVASAIEGFGGYYSLGFSPEHGGDGELHELDVKVKGRGLEVWHPESYVARPGR